MASDKDNEEVIVILEVSDDQMEYRIIVRSIDGKALTEKDFIMNLEMWLHDIDQSMGLLSDPSTQVH